MKATVFGSNIAPPSMSLEEFGDIQKEEAIERERKQAESEQKGRRYKDILAAGEEDDIDLVDEVRSNFLCSKQCSEIILF